MIIFVKKDMEIWKDIKGFDNYKVSNLGNIKNSNFKRMNKEQEIKSTKNSSGYLLVSLFYKGKRNRVMVHRLVASEFLENKENKSCVNHINGIKTDNRVENLEWNTYSENTLHAFKHGLMKNANGENQHLSKLKEKDVLDIRKNEYNLSYRKLAIKYNVSTYAIYSVVKNKTWKHI